METEMKGTEVTTNETIRYVETTEFKAFCQHNFFFLNFISSLL